MAQTSWRWWQTGIIYQIYPRSFMDSNGDGVGDLQGIIDRLDYLNDGTEKSLGVTAIWLSPFYPSPMADFGYDISDYTNVDPIFGDITTFDRLVAEVHRRGMRLIVDYVPNHSSDQHVWFQESRSSRNNPRRDWYIWRDAKPDGSPPNNWGSLFGGPAWTWDEHTGQYYFHQFDPGQPDLNWRNPEVRQAMMDVLRFWMQRGVDGFRMDVVNMIWKHPDMPDQPIIPDATGRGPDDIHGRQRQIYAWNYDGIHDVMREIRATLDEFEDTFSVGEIWLPLEERIKYYGAGDELHMPFNFGLISAASFLEQSPWEAEAIRAIVDEYEAALPSHGWPNWVLGNHDVSRLVSRLGSYTRARVAAMLLLTLRGTPTIYMGEELGMLNGVIEPHQVQDPQGRILGVEHTRDMCRTPMLWDDRPYAGFSTQQPWLPVNEDYPTMNVSSQNRRPRSMLAFYRRLCWLRGESAALTIGSYQSLDSAPHTFVYLREHESEVVLVALNFTEDSQPVDLPRGGVILLSTHQDRDEHVHDTIFLRPDEGLIIRLDA